MTTDQGRQPSAPATYREAGVDIDAGNRLAHSIGRLAATTATAGVLAGVGGFGALVQLPPGGAATPLLVSSTDGVGTKLLIARYLGRYRSLGIDLVAMVVNDLLPCGARPLFFLDYIAAGSLAAAPVEEIVEGIALACRKVGCALVGGETAEMPGVYPPEGFDLAGFGVGLVDRHALIDGSRVEEGDRVVGLASSGLHSNGFSLVRHLLPPAETDMSALLPPLDRPLGDELLEPTRLYGPLVHRLTSSVDVRAMAHITGGGLPENLPRTLPPHMGARLHLDAWPLPPVFRLLQTRGRLGTEELYRTFNCGIGYTVVVPGDDVDRTLDLCRSQGVEAFEIGVVLPMTSLSSRVILA